MLDPLDFMTEVERTILRHAIADTGRGIYASPLIGRSHDNVGRYLTEGGDLLPSHDWRSVWTAVVQLLGREPNLLDGRAPTQAELAATRAERKERAEALLVDAKKAFDAADWAGALALVDQAELAAPLHRPSHRTYADVRGFVLAEQAKHVLVGAK